MTDRLQRSRERGMANSILNKQLIWITSRMENIRMIKQTSLTLKAAPPLESPSSFVKMAPVIPISRLNVVTKAVNSQRRGGE